jgi:hypothetical protein
LLAVPICEEIIVNSTDIGNTFRGSFNLTDSSDVRPTYFNADENLYLYFHSSGDCHFWAISTATVNNRWIMYSYDISPRPESVQAVWNVRRSSGWQEDPDLHLVCQK